MAEMMMDGKKFYDKDDFASKGVAGTALGLGIGALGLEVLKNGTLGNLFGTQQPQNQEESAFGLYKGYRDSDAAKAFNVHYIGISKCCRGVLKTAYGYVWKYYNTFFMGDMIHTIKTRVA